jgi:translation initiation factor IF-2
VEVASHSSTVDEETAELVRELLSEQAAQGQKVVQVPATVAVRDFADALGLPHAQVLSALIETGTFASLNETISLEQAQKAGEKLGFTVREGAAAPAPSRPRPKPKASGPGPYIRPPVVTVLGHVDHGKTSLLDAIRHTNVTASEFGGITQHIGAYQVTHRDKSSKEEKVITFIDTPGHEAFTAMRARGAQVTDIAVLVVAADDGVMPQTIEAIDHARAAGVPIIVALNKMDRPEANPDRVKQQLAEHGLMPEDWGGDTMVVPVSAITGMGLEDLLESILLQAEMLELTADPSLPARGAVIESRVERGRGAVATVLVQEGTLRIGDAVVVGSTYGKIKAMMDDRGDRLQKAGPSTPVEVLGLEAVPNAGDTLEVVSDEKTARQIAEERQEQEREKRLREQRPRTLQDLYNQMQRGETRELRVVLRCDVDGSAEAIRQKLEALGQESEEVTVRVLQSSVGAVGESDVMLAAASDAVVIAFNVNVDRAAREAAEREHVEIRRYNIIYELLDDVRKALSGLLEPEVREEVLGHAEVRALFRTPRGVVAGCYVQDGKIQRNTSARVLRDGQEVWKGQIASLRHFKEDVREMAAGFECGIQLDGFDDVQEGDVIECFTVSEVARTL